MDRLREVIPFFAEHRQRVRNGFQSLVQNGFLVGKLADQTVQALSGREDVALLIVEVADEPFQLLDKAAQILLTAGECGAECLGDVFGNLFSKRPESDKLKK